MQSEFVSDSTGGNQISYTYTLSREKPPIGENEGLPLKPPQNEDKDSKNGICACTKTSIDSENGFNSPFEEPKKKFDHNQLKKIGKWIKELKDWILIWELFKDIFSS